MNILMANLLDWDNPSAGKIHFTGLASGFQELGHHVTAILPSRQGGVMCGAFDDCICVRPYSESMLGQCMRAFQVTRAIARAISSRQPDIFYFRFRACAPFVCIVARLLRRRMTVVSEHNGWSAGLLSMSGYRASIVAFTMWSQLFTARHSDVVRTVSKQLKTIFKEHGMDERRIVVVGTGANLKHFKPVAKEEACSSVGLDPANKYIGFIGNLTRWQGVDVLIRSAQAIIEAEPSSRFIIVGDGAEMDELRQLADELAVGVYVDFRGHVHHEQVPLLTSCLDVGIGPLVMEMHDRVSRCPIKLREYAACGVPAVSAVGGEGAELFEEQGALVRVGPSNPDELARAVIHILENPEVGSSMGQAARGLAERYSSWTHKAEKILECCERSTV